MFFLLFLSFTDTKVPSQCDVKKWQSVEITRIEEARIKEVEAADPSGSSAAQLVAPPQVALSPLGPRGIYREGS